MNWLSLVITIGCFVILFIISSAIYVSLGRRLNEKDREINFLLNLLGVDKNQSTLLSGLISFRDNLFSSVGHRITTIAELVEYVDGLFLNDKDVISLPELAGRVGDCETDLQPLRELLDLAETLKVPTKDGDDDLPATDILANVVIAVKKITDESITEAKERIPSPEDIEQTISAVEKEKPIKQMMGDLGIIAEVAQAIVDAGFKTINDIPTDETKFVESVDLAPKKSKIIHAKAMAIQGGKV